MPSNPESSSALIRQAFFKDRKKYFQGREGEYGITGEYRGTAKQNTDLKNILEKHPELAKKYAQEVLQKYLSINQKNTRTLTRGLRSELETKTPRSINVATRLRNRIRAILNIGEHAETGVTRDRAASRLTRGIQYSRDVTTDVSYYSERVKALGDYVARAGAPNTGNNSCGAAVGTLLNNFGLRNALPQSGRDGKNWDEILDKLVARGLFKKVPCNHPSNALPGGVLVYNGGSKYGSRANYNHGHVEIVSSQGQYVSYYKGNSPGGSAKSAPDAKSMGFCGFVYYPV